MLALMSTYPTLVEILPLAIISPALLRLTSPISVVILATSTPSLPAITTPPLTVLISSSISPVAVRLPVLSTLILLPVILPVDTSPIKLVSSFEYVPDESLTTPN